MNMWWWIWLAIAVALSVAVFFLSRYQMFVERRQARRSKASQAGKAEHGVFVIFNPSKQEDVTEFKTRVQEAAKKHGIGYVHWLETTIDDPGTGQAITALRRGAALVVAAGGDGTVRAVAAGMAHSGVRMGILPQGTGNLFARNLGIPIEFGPSADIAFGDHERTVDLAWLRMEQVEKQGEFPPEGSLLIAADAASVRQMPRGTQEPHPDEYAYVVIAGLGFDGATMAQTSSDLKKSVGWIAYVVAALKSLRNQRMKARLELVGAISPSPSRLEELGLPPTSSGVLSGEEFAAGFPDAEPSEVPDGAIPHAQESIRAAARTILFANCGELPFVVLAPDADFDDGLLDVIAVDTKAGLAGWATLAGKVLAQGAGARPLNIPASLGQIAFRQAQSGTVTVDDAQPVEVDGDEIGTARRIHARVDKHALRLTVPAERRGA